MDIFDINLNEMSQKRKRLFRVWAYGAMAILVLAGLSLYFLQDMVGHSYWLIAVILLVYLAAYIYFTRVTIKTKLYIKSDEYALEYRFGVLSKSEQIIIWDVLTRVKIGPTYIAFYKRTGKRKVIRLGWLPYSKVVEIKDKIESVCNDKGIKYEIAQYNEFN